MYVCFCYSKCSILNNVIGRKASTRIPNVTSIASLSSNRSSMELKGEEVYTGCAYLTGHDFYSETWYVDMPPSTAFVKTYLYDHVLFVENGAVEIGILNIRYHLPDNSDGRVNLPGLEWPDSVKAWFNSNITHFTFAIKVRQCYALMSRSVGYWSGHSSRDVLLAGRQCSQGKIDSWSCSI